MAAVGGPNESALSPEVAAWPVISPPTRLAVVGSAGALELSWDLVAGATGYNLYVTDTIGIPPASGTRLANVPMPFRHAGLVPGRTWTYVVTAFDQGGESAPSAVAFAPYTETAVATMRVVGPTTIDLGFSRPMHPGDVADPANFTLSGSGRGTLAEHPGQVVALSATEVRLAWPGGEPVGGGELIVAVAATVRDAGGVPVGAISGRAVASGPATVGPVVSGIEVLDGRRVAVSFSEPVMSLDALQPGNYELAGAGRGTLTTHPDRVASLSASRVRLEWLDGEMRTGGDVTVAVATAVRDLAGNRLALPRTGSHVGGGRGTAPAVTVNTRVDQPDPTAAATVIFSVMFSEPVTGFGSAAVVLGGTAEPTTATIQPVSPFDGSRYEVTVSGMARDGTVTATVPAGRVTDLAGNPNSAATSTDNTCTRVTGAPTVLAVRVIDALQIAVTTSEPVATAEALLAANYALTGGGRGTLATTPATVAAVASTVFHLRWNQGEMMTGGDLTVTLATGVRNLRGVPMGAPRSGTHVGGGIGGVGPTVTVNQAGAQADPTNVTPVRFEVVFSEPIRSFDGSCVAIGGTAGPTTVVVAEGFPNDGTAFTVSVGGPTGPGSIWASIPGGRVTDRAGNPNSSSTSTDGVITLDTASPTVTAFTLVDGLHFDVTFSRAMNPTDVAEVRNYTLSGDGRGTLSAQPVRVAPVVGNRYRLSWGGGEMKNGGDLTITVAAPVRDVVGNRMGVPRSATIAGGGMGGMAPILMVNQAADQPDPACNSPVHFTAFFSEPVVGFGPSGVVLSGTAVPSQVVVSEIAPFDGTTYDLAVSGMTGDGTIVAVVAASACADLAGNPNESSASLDNSVRRDTVRPKLSSVSLSYPGRTMYVSFSRKLNPTDALMPANYTVSGPGRGTLATCPDAVTRNGDSGDSFIVTWLSGEPRSGSSLTLTADPAMRDTVGNLMSATNAVTLTVAANQVQSPYATWVRAADQPSPTAVGPIRYRLTFNEPVVGFEAADVSLAGTAQPSAVNLTELAPNNATVFEVAVTGMATEGTVIPSLAAGVCHDPAGNPNQPRTGDTTVYEPVPPSVAAVTVIDGKRIDVRFSRAVRSTDALVAGNYTVSGSGRGSFPDHPTSVASAGADQVRLLWLTGEMAAGGDLTITVASAVKSVAGTPLGEPRSGTHVGGAVGIPFAVESLSNLSPTEVEVRFSKPPGAGGTSTANYTISGAGKGTVADHPSSVTVVGNNNCRLAWAAGSISLASTITIAMTGMVDGAGNPLVAPTSVAVPTRVIDVETVAVGDAGNAVDSRTGLGGVARAFRIGRYEVTNAQYGAFLNAVAVSDPYALYDPRMATAVANDRGGIDRAGGSGTYSYSVPAKWQNKPVNYISYCGAVRFVNWLHNGAFAGAPTEDGAYPIIDGGPNSGSIGQRNPAAAWCLPSEDEWYKAAYYKGGGLNAGYWLYPTRSDSDYPTRATADSNGNVSNPGSQVVNYDGQASWNNVNYGNVTTVGSVGPSSAGFYGTYDQGGNVAEYCEAVDAGNVRIRGGNWLEYYMYLTATYGYESIGRTTRTYTTGFRVAR